MTTSTPTTDTPTPVATGDEPASPRPRRATLSHQPFLDGLRGIAMIGIIFYHSDFSTVPGTFFTVDLFFVLSGYLITSLLILEQRSTGGIALKAFWLRRARRLLPALFALVTLIALYAFFVADPGRWDDIRGDGLATLAYFTNWHFIINGTSYFDQFAEPSPLRHAWTLAIEEQWYVVWPVVAMLLLRRAKGRTRALAAPVFGAALASAALMAVLYDPLVDPSRVYYGTDTRAQSLLVGSALAFLLTGRKLVTENRWMLTALGWAGAATCLTMFAFVHIRDSIVYRGGFLVFSIACAAVIASCNAEGRSVLRTALSWRPFTYAGEVSYGLYLFHWPIFVYLNPERTGLEGLALFAARITATLALTILSNEFVEMPVRKGIWQRRWGAANVKWVAGTTLVATACLLVIATANAPAEKPPVNTGVADAGDLQVMVIGDSTANAIAENFDPNRYDGVAVIPKGFPGCGIMAGQMKPPGEPPEPPRCESWAEFWQKAVDQEDPDLSLVMIGGWEHFDTVVDGKLLVLGSPEFEARLDEQLQVATDILSSKGGQVGLIVPYCQRPFRFDDKPTVYTDERYQMVRDLIMDWGAENAEAVATVDLGGYLCPGGAFATEMDGVKLFADGVHLNEQGAQLAWDWIIPQVLRIAEVSASTTTAAV